MSDAGKRQFDRVPSKVLAQLRLDDGRVQDGITRDMGLGGVFLVTPLPPPNIPRGTPARLAMTLFDRPVEIACHVAHCNQEGIGIQLERISLDS